ncbi:MAG: single-stranded DNA-binding protein [Spirochaetae bacterium HGW-Spirochaetae-1]|jgi:single-strand DNA-binding protein|nr:MAG: single-stranded DNA-binding protein [Spirochaetae bacterium HGW-Spirochaetae-1]
MARDLNRTILIGNLVKDPEAGFTPNGSPLTNFTIASNDEWGTGDQKQEHVSYFDIVAWGKVGEVVAKYCKKGSKVSIEAKLKQERWQNSDGKTWSRIVITAETVQFLTPKKDDFENNIPV